MRWALIGVVVVGFVILGVVAVSPALHAPGTVDCSALEEDPSHSAHGTHESDMYTTDDEVVADCPVDDAAGMGATAWTGGPIGA